MKHIILFLILSISVFGQSNLLTLFDGNSKFISTIMPSTGDSIKAHWVFDSLWLADNGKYIISNHTATPITFSDELITNGTFTAWSGDNPSSWSVSGENATNLITENPTGQARFTQDGTSYLYMEQSATATDSIYYINFDLNAMSTGGIMVNLASGGQRDYNPTSSGIGNKTWIIKAPSVFAHRIQRTATLSGYSTIDNFSSKKIRGTNYLINNFNCDIKNNFLGVSPIYENGQILKLDFDYGQYGDAWYIDATRCTDLNPALNSFSIETIINPTNFVDAKYIIAKHEADGSPAYYLRIDADSTAYFKVVSADGTSVAVSSTVHLARDNWYYVVAVLNREDNTIKVYVNGEASSGSASALSGKTVEPNYQFCIGQIAPSSASTFLGYIAEVRFLTRALTPAEITGWYKQLKINFSKIQ